jgi:Uma2 family endonuclease
MSATASVRAAESAAIEQAADWQLSVRATMFPLLIRPESPLTDEELLEFCRSNKGFTIECESDGTLYVMTPAGAKTSRLNAFIGRELDIWAEADGQGFSFGSDLGVRFPDRSMRAPDGAWTFRSRFEELDKSAQDGFLPFCPEFVIELRSPSDRTARVEAKMESWIARGSKLGWLIDPQRKLAMIYRSEREPETLTQPEYLIGEGPIAGFRLKMQRFWE